MSLPVEAYPLKRSSFAQLNIKISDFLVGGSVVVELKTVDQLLNVHTAQVLTYLKFSKSQIGLLMNFRSTILSRGLKRLAL